MTTDRSISKWEEDSILVNIPMPTANNLVLPTSKSVTVKEDQQLPTEMCKLLKGFKAMKKASRLYNIETIITGVAKNLSDSDKQMQVQIQSLQVPMKRFYEIIKDTVSIRFYAIYRKELNNIYAHIILAPTGCIDHIDLYMHQEVLHDTFALLDLMKYMVQGMLGLQVSSRIHYIIDTYTSSRDDSEDNKSGIYLTRLADKSSYFILRKDNKIIFTGKGDFTLAENIKSLKLNDLLLLYKMFTYS